MRHFVLFDSLSSSHSILYQLLLSLIEVLPVTEECISLDNYLNLIYFNPLGIMLQKINLKPLTYPWRPSRLPNLNVNMSVKLKVQVSEVVHLYINLIEKISFCYLLSIKEVVLQNFLLFTVTVTEESVKMKHCVLLKMFFQ